jgi:hypothetical protein
VVVLSCPKLEDGTGLETSHNVRYVEAIDCCGCEICEFIVSPYIIRH